MYFYRILDVLREEYPKVVASVGDGAFHNLVTDYLLDCRPAHPSLREVGGRLPAYLSRHALARERPWLAELARLERAHLELHDGPDAEALTLDQIRAQAPEALPALFLRAIPCHRVLDNRHAISELWTALEAGAGESASVSQPAPAPGPAPPAATRETLLVWRPGLATHPRLVDGDEGPLLAALGDGARFEVLCDQLLDSVGADQAAQRAFELLARWIGEGMLARGL
jgi:hypothetical protein